VQVSLLAMSPAGAASGTINSLLLPELFKSASPSKQTQAWREQRDGEERRRRDGDDPQALVAGTTIHGATRAIQDAERNMAPGSRAARQAAQGDQDQKPAQQRGAFQKTLADANARENRSSAGRESANESTGEKPAATPQRAEPVAKEAPSNETPPRDGAKPQAANETRRASTAPSSTARTASATTVAAPSNAAAPTTATVGAGRALTALAATARVAAPTSTGTSPVAAKGGTAPTAAFLEAKSIGTRAATSSTRAAPAQTTEEGKSDANVEQVLRVLRSQITQNRAQTTLRLDPPEFGTVKLHLDLRQDVLALRIDTQTDAAHRLLSKEIESLRHGLEAGGIHLERVEVRPPAATPNPDQSALPQQPDAHGQSGQNAADAHAEHAAETGTEAHLAAPTEIGASETFTESATESLLNILA
jgi:flagellar hook-length control protein FliK